MLQEGRRDLVGLIGVTQRSDDGTETQILPDRIPDVLEPFVFDIDFGYSIAFF
jgi:hypothetical protein